MPQFLDFDQAVIISREVENYFNDPKSDNDIIFLARKFNLGIRENFVVSTKAILRNCPECSGCHNEVCTLGCFDSEANVVCLWDQALEEIIGTKLILHEYGHVIYDQIFTNELSEEEAFEQSEEFAQFVENNFDIAVDNCLTCSETPLMKVFRKTGYMDMTPEGITGISAQEMKAEVTRGIIAGLSLAIGGAIFAYIISKSSNKTVELVG